MTQCETYTQMVDDDKVTLPMNDKFTATSFKPRRDKYSGVFRYKGFQYSRQQNAYSFNIVVVN